MIIVDVQEMKKYHAANLVLDGVTFQLQEGERAGLIGRNGSGKSTLLSLLSGHEQADGGLLSIKKDLQVGYLPQIPAEFESLTVYDALAYGFRELRAAKREMSLLEERMSSPEATGDAALMAELLRTYAHVQERFEQGGGYEMDTAIDQAASGLRIDRSLDGRRFGSLSGGEKTRIALASQLVVKPGLLLLDEPTNHLDLQGIEWLEGFLQRYEGACVVVSHDRYFLDAVADKMIELEDGEAHVYLTDYSGYVKEKETRLLQQFAMFQEQQKTIKKMKETIRQLEEWGRLAGNEKFFKRAASIRKALERMEQVKRPVLEQKTADFALTPQDRSGRRVIAFEGVTKRYGARALLNGAEGSLLYGEKTVLLGDNGSGKTTLFDILLGACVADSGTVALGARVDVGYLAQQAPVPDPKLTVLSYFRTEGELEEGEARNVLAHYLFYGNDVFKPLQQLSGGEWTRLRLALLVRRKPNLLLLDEPTNHLDAASREALEEALEAFQGTVLAISHDRYFINRLAKRVWSLEQGKIAVSLGNYDDFKAGRNARAALEAERSNTFPNKKTEAKPTQPGGKADGANPAEASVGPNKKKATSADATGVAKKSTEKSNERRRSRLEAEIAALEAELAIVEAELYDSGPGPGSGEDAAALEERWHRREQLRDQLDKRMEAWLEL